MSVLIKGGRIVTAADDYVGDVYIDNGTITLIGESLDLPADKVIDATGKYVIPGAIDPHTHIEMFFGGTTTCDDFTSGTVAAAFGGTTSLIDFCMQAPGTPFPQALENYFEKIDRCKPVIDVGFHIGVTDLEGGGGLEALAKLPDEGVTSYKLFMAYKGAVMVDDETLFKVLQTAADTGGLVMVHAENGDAIDVIVKEAVAAGKSDPIWHARTRPMETEAEATNRAVQLARIAGSPLYVVHVSCQPAVEPIALAREKGWNVWGETCTQYLFIDDTALEKPNFEGAKYIYTPPPRPKEEQEHLWKALGSDVLSVVSTDHCPFNWPEQKGINGREFQVVPNGGPGIENRLHMLHEFGVRTGRITLNRFVELTSTNVAKLFGLYPRKGTIAVGSDADIVVWDPEKELTISAETHHTNVNYNLFEGTKVTGAPEVVLVRGQVIVENDELVGQPGDGQFVKRARFGEKLTPAEQRDGMSDEQANEVYAKAGLGESVTLGSRPAVLVVDFSCGFTDPECTLGSDMTAEVEATKRLLDAARAKGLPVDLHDDRLRAEPEGRRPLAAEGAAPRRPPDRRPLGRDRPAARAARGRDDRAQEGRVRVLRHEPRLDPRLAGRRLGDPLRGDDERLHPGDRGRPAPVRLADDRPARVRRRPRAGAARGEPVRHPGEVRRRRLGRGGARVRRGRASAGAAVA